MKWTGAAALAATRLPIRHIYRLGASVVPVLRKSIPLLVSAILLVAAATVAVFRSDLFSVAETLVRLTGPSLAAAFVLLLAGAMLAAWRLKIVAQDLGYHLSFRDSVSALSLGQIGGILFFQIAGQLLARGVLLSRRDIPMSGTIVVTIYERLAALAVSLLFAISAALFLYGHITINPETGGLLITKIFLGLLSVTVSGALFCWGTLMLQSLPPLSRTVLFRLSRSIALSVAIQATTMAAYVILLKSLAPEISTAQFAAASALIMFAASLPISFAGWGMRELSAIVALGTVGVSSSVSFAVATAIGITSLVVVGIMAATATSHGRGTTLGPLHQKGIKVDFGVVLDYALPLFAATAVFFQIFVPVNGGKINVNLADPAVIAGGSLFVLHSFKAGLPRWRMPSFEIYVGLATLVIITAFLHGLVSFGWTTWAFTNRLLGWFVLLAYGATGALLIQRAGQAGLELLFRTFVIVAASIVALELFLLLFYHSGIESFRSLSDLPLMGFSANRNAFAFQLLLAIGLGLSLKQKVSSWVLGLLLAGIWFCGSRAAYAAVPIVLVVAAFVGCLSLRRTIAFGVVATAIVLLTSLVPWLLANLSGTEPLGSVGGIYRQVISSSPGDSQHIKTMIDGWAMFLAQPVFGAGLGAYMHQQTEAGMPLVIHSTPLWLMAELGIIGLGIMVIAVVRIFLSEAHVGRRNDAAGMSLLLIITAFGVVCNAHEIMYQRAFWLLLGAALAFLPRYLPHHECART